jgi:hypothetical protein
VHLAPGRHVLVVRADWRSPRAMKADAWGRAWFNFGGINREVTLRRLGPSELDAPGIRTRLAPDGAALVTVTARFAQPRHARAGGARGREPRRRPAALRPGAPGPAARGLADRERAVRPPGAVVAGAPAAAAAARGRPRRGRARRARRPARAALAGRAPAPQRPATSCCAERRSTRTPPAGATRCGRATWTPSSRRLRCDRRQRYARPAPAVAGAAGAPRRRGDPRVAGDRPGRLAGAWTSTTPARTRSRVAACAV